MLVSLTVGKADAGVAVLLTPDKRLIEFPSILLPPNISSGSIVDITVGRNLASETAADADFHALQERIYRSFGTASPQPPVLRCRNATQTSVVLEWDPIELATADLISLSLYRNGQKAGAIPRPLDMHSTKISGLSIDTEYTFHLILRTTAGTHTSERVTVKTHKMTDLSGVTITTGIMPSYARDALAQAVARVGAKIVDGVRIDTTHFVTVEGRGMAWEKAVEMNIPVVRPEWVDACEKTGRILGVTKFYLDAMRPGPGEYGMGGSPAGEVGSGSGGSSAPPDRRTSVATTPTDKALPPTPAAPNATGPTANGHSAEKGEAEDKAAAAVKEEGGRRSHTPKGSESDDSEHETRPPTEQKTHLPDPDAQKVRLEENDLPIRPVKLEPSEPVLKEEDNDNHHHHHDDDEDEDEEKEQEDYAIEDERHRDNRPGVAAEPSEKKTKNTEDGSSFQDVAL